MRNKYRILHGRAEIRKTKFLFLLLATFTTLDNAKQIVVSLLTFFTFSLS